MKNIFILFTQYKDWFAQFLSVIHHHRYSHVSLSLNYECGVFYSFNVKGFCSETLDKHRKHGVTQSALYQLQVSDDIYDKITGEIKETLNNKSDMKYSFLGVALNLLHIPFHWKNHYFCSEYIAALLKKSGAVRLCKPPSLYLPEQLRMELDKAFVVNRFVNVV